MRNNQFVHAIAVCGLAVGIVAPAHADVRITEIMFERKGLGTVEFKKDGVTPNPKVIDDKREFFEITNLGSIAVDISGWVYDDDKAGDSSAFGSVFGSLLAGESLVITEMAVEDFRALWNLDSTAKIFSIGGSSNLGKNDTINIYDSVGNIVDSVTYAVGFGASGISYDRPSHFVGAINVADGWVQSKLVDAYHTVQSGNLPLTTYNTLEGGILVPHTETTPRFDVGNPGYYPVAAVPEPETYAMMLVGLGLLGLRCRGRKKQCCFRPPLS